MQAIRPLMVLGLLLSSPALAQEADFNEAFLYNPTGTKIDLGQFRYGNPIAEGEYLADIYINKQFYGRQMLVFGPSQDEPIRALCWSDDFLSVLDVKEGTLKLPKQKTACLSALDVAPDFTFAFDVSSHRLDISIPQALLIERPKGYVPRHLWQQGVNVGFLQYQLHHHQNLDPYQRYQYGSLGLKAGVNLGPWSLRHHGGTSWQNSKFQAYQNHETYLQRDLDQLNGRLRIGQANTQGNLLENIKLQGIFLASDRRMMPNGQNSYAPQISGHAKTNAVVRVRQKDVIIYEQSVAAGPFIINDLHTFSSDTDSLLVEVIEEDGSKQTSLVPFFNSLKLLRPKQLVYQAALGYYQNNHQTANKPLLHASAQYGINNHVTLEAGGILHPDYQLLSSGLTLGTPLGILSGLVSLSNTDESGKPLIDHLRLGINRHFSSTKTQLNADVLQFFSDKSIDLSSAVLGQETGSLRQNKLKTQYRLGVHQKLGSNLGGLRLSALANHYWQGSGDYNYQIGYGNHFKKIQYQLGITKNFRAKQDDTSFYAQLFIPFDWGIDQTRSKQLNASLDYSQQGDDRYQRVSVSQGFGDFNQYQYSLSASQKNQQEPSLFGSLHASLSPVKLGLSISKNGDRKQYSYSASGAIVAHPHGLTLSHDLGQTFGIVHAKDAKGVALANGKGGKIDRWGNGIISHLNAYQKNHLGIDARYLPDHIEIGTTSKEVIPRANTAQLVELKTRIVYPMLLDIDKKGKSVPFGAQAKDPQGNLLGYVTPDGRLPINSSQASGQIIINWQQGQERDSCSIFYQFDTSQAQNIGLQILPVTCQ